MIASTDGGGVGGAVVLASVLETLNPKSAAVDVPIRSACGGTTALPSGENSGVADPEQDTKLDDSPDSTARSPAHSSPGQASARSDSLQLLTTPSTTLSNNSPAILDASNMFGGPTPNTGVPVTATFSPKVAEHGRSGNGRSPAKSNEAGAGALTAHEVDPEGHGSAASRTMPPGINGTGMSGPQTVVAGTNKQEAQERAPFVPPGAPKAEAPIPKRNGGMGSPRGREEIVGGPGGRGVAPASVKESSPFEVSEEVSSVGASVDEPSRATVVSEKHEDKNIKGWGALGRVKAATQPSSGGTSSGTGGSVGGNAPAAVGGLLSEGTRGVGPPLGAAADAMAASSDNVRKEIRSRKGDRKDKVRSRSRRRKKRKKAEACPPGSDVENVGERPRRSPEQRRGSSDHQNHSRNGSAAGSSSRPAEDVRTAHDVEKTFSEKNDGIKVVHQHGSRGSSSDGHENLVVADELDHAQKGRGGRVEERAKAERGHEGSSEEDRSGGATSNNKRGSNKTHSSRRSRNRSGAPEIFRENGREGLQKAEKGERKSRRNHKGDREERGHRKKRRDEDADCEEGRNNGKKRPRKRRQSLASASNHTPARHSDREEPASPITPK